MTGMEPEYYDVLLSYAAADAALAEAVRQQLTAEGLHVYSPFADIRPDEYEDRLRPAFDRTRAYAAIVSRASLGSPFLLVEAAAAWALRVPGYLLLTDLRRADVTGFLERYPSYPLWKGFPKLVSALRTLPQRVPA